MKAEKTCNIITKNLEDFYVFLGGHINSEITKDFIHLKEYPYEGIIYVREPSKKVIDVLSSIPDLRNSFPTIIFRNTGKPGSAELKSAGYIPITRWKGMAIDSIPVAEPIQGLEFVKVNNQFVYKQWEKVAYSVFHEWEKDPAPLPYSRIYRSENAKLYLGLYKNEPACIGAIFENRDSAGIYFIGTGPSHRGMGFGKAITCWLAARAGSKKIVLQASSEGFNMYLKLGFAEFCNFDLYRLMPDED